MIRNAKMNDMETIMAIIQDIVVEMQKNGSDQWNASYPAYEDFAKDIAAGELFVETDKEGTIRAFACMNTDAPAEYKDVPWESPRKAIIIHRMAVSLNSRGQGLAKKLMEYAEDLARESGIAYMKSDTYCLNTGMNSLFKKLNYTAVGNIHFPGRKNSFICYEKKLIP